MRVSHVGVIVILFLLSFFLSAGVVVADWHGGKALVLYKKGGDGWVEWNYKDRLTWEKFRNEFAEQDWTVDFAKHVNASLLSNYDALFVLTPCENIPDDEAQAIIDWVKSGGQLVITQNGTGTYANNITAEFGIEFDGCRAMEINKFASHPVTTTPYQLNKVVGITARKIKVSGSSKEIGWFKGKYCLLAVNDSAGEGVVVAIGDEWMWSKWRFNKCENEELLDNILAYFRRTCSVPEFSTLTFLIPVFLLAVLFLFRRKG
ncbi:MAG: DUF2194 domain-containing protein [Methanophagales archaeon]|nr:DUF2194 domain-containing protein [Methanophagales archaeon]